MRIGSILENTHNGKHEVSELVILFDHKKKERILYNMTYKVRVGETHALYARYTGRKLTKKQVKELSKKIGAS